MPDKVMLINNMTIEDYINEAVKSDDFNTNGIIIEHLIIDADSKNKVSFHGESGVSYIIDELSVYYPDAKMDMSDFINGFSTDRFHIYLDEENKLIINILPLENTALIIRLYQSFRNNINEIISPLGYECIIESGAGTN